ncbi:UDP-glucose 6-dehydrogenase [Methanococcus maripaludis]|uniref:UDP-glucose 6-dehydrogenase n=1 Tax=Methanococcus maripaludis TaxID=39152 RepID=A0A7J9NNG0_METMI|nr:UDP-glucose 6-dehydrogenase [Methanococcus maripaludis]
MIDAVTKADGIIITVEDNNLNIEDWNDIFKLTGEKVIFDGKNILDKEKIKKIGFEYIGVGLK